MSKFIVPNTFVPGTKAKAQEVNENFTAVQNELNLKAEKTGDINQTFLIASATEEHHAITKGQVKTLLEETTKEIQQDFSNLNPFCIEKGYMDENGNPAIISINGSIINFNVDDGTTYGSIFACPANNQPKFKVTHLDSIDISAFTDGTYNIFVTSEETAYLLNNEIYVQKSEPTSPTLNCIFENTSKSPISVEKFNGTEWELFNDVLLGTVVIQNGAVTKIINSHFNDNWANKPATTISTASSTKPVVITENYVNGYSWFRVFSDGWCEQGGVISSKVKTNIKITLLKKYANTNYDIFTNQQKYNELDGAGDTIGAYPVSGSQINIWHAWYGGNCTTNVFWTTHGYLEKGEY